MAIEKRLKNISRPGLSINIQGQVQGVGFRPRVWRLAKKMGLTGYVRNVINGVEIKICGDDCEGFTDQLLHVLPPSARIDDLVKQKFEGDLPDKFEILDSLFDQHDNQSAEIIPDQASCRKCIEEIFDPFNRRYRYPFNSCVDCGPRFSIIEETPYDRIRITMKNYNLCEDCNKEFHDPEDRRFHAQTIACHRCGPKAWLEKLGVGTVDYQAYSMMDSVDAAAGLIKRGYIVAVKGIGGFNLMCSISPEVVKKLRSRKKRPSKPFALMARDIDVVKKYCQVSNQEEKILQNGASPIVLLNKRKEMENRFFEEVSSGMNRLGFMLPATPLHHLIMKRISAPVVMTSGNLSGFTQCIDNEDARKKLSELADFALMHDREIAHQVDDSVVTVLQNEQVMIRGARGYAPSSIVLPSEFGGGKRVLAMGAHLKNTFCLIQDNKAIVSHHLGDLERYPTVENYRHQLDLFHRIYRFSPEVIVADNHMNYFSSQEGERRAEDIGVPLLRAQHHHAHLVSCLMENGRFLISEERALGIVLDGTGLGDDGTVWGGEFLLFNYHGYERVGCIKPVRLLGGEAAVKQPWRNLYAHLRAEMSWKQIDMEYGELEIIQKLKSLSMPVQTLEAMISTGECSPLSSSCGRLFDAAAVLTGLVWEKQDYEGQAAMLFESCLDEDKLSEPDDLIYPFRVPRLKNGLPYIEPLSVWQAMLGDLILGTPIGTISARFHRGLAGVLSKLALRLCEERVTTEVVLSGGCFQNKTLTALIIRELAEAGIRVFIHRRVPPNDGGVSLGQAGIALAGLNRKK